MPISLKNKKIVVTGGAGFIGSHLVDALVKEGAEVITIDNHHASTLKNLEHLKGKITHYKKDISDYASLKKIFKGAYAILHQAAIASVPHSIQDPQKSHHTNTLGTLNVFRAAQEAGVDRVIYASSAAVYGDTLPPNTETMLANPLSPYAVQKYANELYGKIFHNLHGLKTIGLRYFNVFGPRQSMDSAYAAVIPKFIIMMKKGKRPQIYGDGKNTRDFTYIDNVVQANILALKTEKGFGDVYNIAVGVPTSLNDLIEKINIALGTSIKPEYIGSKKGDIRHSFADISKAKKVLGFKPKDSFMEGLKKTIDSL